MAKDADIGVNSFPKDWPEDAKVGPKFLAELMRRFPDRVKVGTLEEGVREMDEQSWPKTKTSS